jgi:hypothetical protein
MSVIVFLGPSLPRGEAAAILDADYRPPVRHGDVWRALRERPRAIGIVDGVFGAVPSVWHKEILEALREGAHVFGAASMGALRAAELDPYGMRGVGRIFARFRDGAWRDDDEVALTHGPAEAGYVNLSLPMANLRFTLEAAEAAGALTPAEAAAYAGAAKAVPYPRRVWSTADAAAREAGLAPGRLDAFAAWRREGAVDAKGEDARAMLRALRDFIATDPPPFRPAFRYEPTDLAEHARRRALEV